MRPGVRPFRLGLWFAVLSAAALGLKRLLAGRRAAPTGDGWPADFATEPPSPRMPAARVVPVVEPDVVEVGDVDQPGEPELSTVPDEPSATVEAPVTAAPAKKAAVKKAPAKKAAAKKVAAKSAAAPSSAAWVDPEGSVCPTSHPVKAKLSSKVFHLPGQLAYERTHPDRCYVDEAAAEADGLRKAKR